MTDDTDNAADLDDFKPTASPDRPRGILTKKDRKLLSGREQYENKQQVRDARYRMRKRIKESLLDIKQVQKYYPKAEYEKILNSLADEYGDYAVRWVIESCVQMSVTLAKIGVDSGYFGPREETDLEDVLKGEIHDAIMNAERKVHTEESVLDVNVNIDITRTGFDEEEVLFDLLYEEPSMSQVMSYLQHGDLQKLQRQLKEHDKTIVFEKEGEKMKLDADRLDLMKSIFR